MQLPDLLTFLATQQDSMTALYAAKSWGRPATLYSSNSRLHASTSPPSARPRSTMFIMAQLTGWPEAWRKASCKAIAQLTGWPEAFSAKQAARHVHTLASMHKSIRDWLQGMRAASGGLSAL
eukprot:1159490-Pelagomonas_calceolata.AAC.5